MTLLSHALRQALTRTRLTSGGATAISGIGERRSRVKGEGIEFEDHREYQLGDDLRRLDPHLYTRFGEAYVRQYNVGKQLKVTLLVDASASMAFGTPSKYEFARAVATGLSISALAGSDSVQGAVLHEGTATWHTQVSGLGNLATIERWLATRDPAGPTNLTSSLLNVNRRVTGSGLTILISDLWSDGMQDAIDLIDSSGQALVVVHVLAREELDPSLIGTGALQLADAESGDETSVTVGSEQIDQYTTALQAWIDEVRERVVRTGGVFVSLPSDITLEDTFLRTLPGAGVIR